MICLHRGCFEAIWPLAIGDQDPEVRIVPNIHIRYPVQAIQPFDFDLQQFLGALDSLNTMKPFLRSFSDHFMAESPLRWDLQHKEFLDSFDCRVPLCTDHRSCGNNLVSCGQVGNRKSWRSWRSGFSRLTLGIRARFASCSSLLRQCFQARKFERRRKSQNGRAIKESKMDLGCAMIQLSRCVWRCLETDTRAYMAYAAYMSYNVRQGYRYGVAYFFPPNRAMPSVWCYVFSASECSCLTSEAYFCTVGIMPMWPSVMRRVCGASANEKNRKLSRIYSCSVQRILTGKLLPWCILCSLRCLRQWLHLERRAYVSSLADLHTWSIAVL